MNPHNIYIYNGGSYNDIHDCENVYLSCERAEVHVDKTPEESSALPDKLRTPEAEALLSKFCDAGILNRTWQPVGLSFSEKGTLVEYIAERLDIRSKWKFFGSLWNMDSETLRTSKVRGLDQDKTWKFRAKLDAL